MYELVLYRNINSPLPDQPIRRGWNFQPGSEDGSWDLLQGALGVVSYLTTNLLRRSEAT